MFSSGSLALLPSCSWQPAVVALALSHSATLGVTLALPFFKLLAGREVGWGDCASVDPALLQSCHAILEMDPSEVDRDALGLTFSHEVETFGARSTVELRPGGSFQQVRPQISIVGILALSFGTKLNRPGQAPLVSSARGGACSR